MIVTKEMLRLCEEKRASECKQEAEMRRDAERYRWLRKNGKPAAEGLVMRNPDLWDEAIDAAMAGANAGIEPNRPR